MPPDEALKVLEPLIPKHLPDQPKMIDNLIFGLNHGWYYHAGHKALSCEMGVITFSLPTPKSKLPRSVTLGPFTIRIPIDKLPDLTQGSLISPRVTSPTHALWGARNSTPASRKHITHPHIYTADSHLCVGGAHEALTRATRCLDLVCIQHVVRGVLNDYPPLSAGYCPLENWLKPPVMCPFCDKVDISKPDVPIVHCGYIIDCFVFGCTNCIKMDPKTGRITCPLCKANPPTNPKERI